MSSIAVFDGVSRCASVLFMFTGVLSVSPLANRVSYRSAAPQPANFVPVLQMSYTHKQQIHSYHDLCANADERKLCNCRKSLGNDVLVARWLRSAAANCCSLAGALFVMRCCCTDSLLRCTAMPDDMVTATRICFAGAM